MECWGVLEISLFPTLGCKSYIMIGHLSFKQVYSFEKMSTSNYKVIATLPAYCSQMACKHHQTSPSIFEIMVRVWSEYSVKKHIEAKLFVLWQQKNKETLPLHLQIVCRVNHIPGVLAKQSTPNRKQDGAAKDSRKNTMAIKISFTYSTTFSYKKSSSINDRLMHRTSKEKNQDGIQICTSDTQFLNEDENTRRTRKDKPNARSCTANR